MTKVTVKHLKTAIEDLDLERHIIDEQELIFALPIIMHRAFELAQLEED